MRTQRSPAVAGQRWALGRSPVGARKCPNSTARTWLSALRLPRFLNEHIQSRPGNGKAPRGGFAIGRLSHPSKRQLQKSAELKTLSAAFVTTFVGSGKASTKFATKMQNHDSRNTLEQVAPSAGSKSANQAAWPPR